VGKGSLTATCFGDCQSEMEPRASLSWSGGQAGGLGRSGSDVHLPHLRADPTVRETFVRMAVSKLECLYIASCIFGASASKSGANPSGTAGAHVIKLFATVIYKYYQ
jgi:hypothetical protein